MAQALPTPAQLELRPPNHEVKVQVARRLCRETIVSQKRTTQELAASSWKYLSNLPSTAPATSPQPESGYDVLQN